MASSKYMPLTRLPEEELQTRDARLRTLSLSTSAVVWYTAEDGSVTSAIPSWEAFTGQNSADCFGWGWLDAIHPDDRLQVRSTWEGGVASGVPVELNYRLRRRDGEYRDMAAQGAPVLEHGQLREWVGFCIDVTASKRAEAVLKASEERFKFLDRLGQATRALTDGAEVMAVTARLLGEYLGVTRCAYADVEADSDRFTIRSDWSVAGVPSSAGVYSLDLFGPQATSNLRRGRPLVVRNVDSELGDDGGARMFNAIGIKAVICTGLVKGERLVALMAVHQAVPRNWTAAELSLIEEVVERCWAHIERVRDNAMLREQDQRKDEFLATLAHELRNPLAPMKYAVAMMRRTPDPGQAAKAHDVIDRQVTVMARLIDDLLDLSRINRGLIQLRPETVAVAGLVQQAVAVCAPAIEAAGHHLEVDLPGEALWLEADPTRIVQVVGNLLTNAAKYTPDGGDIRISLRRKDDRAVVEVRDNGIGIPLEHQGRLFQMFTQLRHTSSRAQGGLGIGLALVRTLTELHGGTVRVASAGLDEGSAFTIELPLSQPPQALQATPSAQHPATAARPGAGLHVLVVEDNQDGLQTLLVLLETMGHRATGAADGARGLALARSLQPDVVLLDLGLPGMDGVAVGRALREDPRFDGTTLVALTGWGAGHDRERTAAAGFDAHLTKPVEPAALEAFLVRRSAVVLNALQNQ